MADEPSLRRRRVLRGAGAASAALLAGSAGCSALAPGRADLPPYATWAPAPDRVFRDPAGTDLPAPLLGWYPFRARRFDALAAYLDGRDASFDDTALYGDGSAHPVLDIPPAEAGLEFRGGGRGLAVLETDLADAAVVDAFRTPGAAGPVTEPFEDAGTYEGYSVLSAPDGGWAVGVRDGVVVEAFEAGGFRDPLRGKRAVVAAMIDARAGEGRYADANAALGELVVRLGSALRASVARVAPADAATNRTRTGATGPTPVAAGVAYGVDDPTDARRVLVFRSPADAAAHEPDARDSPTGSWTDVAVSTDGRAVVVDGTADPV